ncbi:WD repeat-containing protein 38-like [Patiria miniata]|uniref:Uncharacterized protein n=1 Tax=Patiria miniata TaxID=46514 RepID=A0A914AAP8_PATMI|nr:WD repeat-containing protein 38-like [Patiria miniata]
MYTLAGVSGAGVARQARPSPSPDALSSKTSTPRSMMSVAPSAGDYEEPQAPPRHPIAEGNLRLLHTVECTQDVMCCRYNDDGTLLAVGCVDGSIKVYSTDTGSALYNLTDQETQDSHLPCTSIVFRPYKEGDKSLNLLLATYASGMVKFWHTATGDCLHTTHEIRQTLTVAYNKDHSMYITAGSDEKINVYDDKTRKKIFTCQPSPSMSVMDGHRFRVFSLKFHPDKVDEFVSGGWDDTVQFWDVRTEHSNRKICGPHVCGDAIDIDPYHNHIVTGSWRKDYNLQIWDYAKSNLIRTVPQDFNNSLLYCAQWLGKDHVLVGGCDANMVRVIDRGTLQTTGRLVDLPRGVYCLDNNRKGAVPKFVAGSARNLYFMEMKQT